MNGMIQFSSHVFGRESVEVGVRLTGDESVVVSFFRFIDRVCTNAVINFSSVMSSKSVYVAFVENTTTSSASSSAMNKIFFLSFCLETFSQVVLYISRSKM